MSAILAPVAAATEESAMTDGFHLVIDALKLNGITTIYGLPGIPITDLTRKAQGEGTACHLLPPRAERRQRRGHRRLHDRQARRVPHGVGARLPQRPDGAGQCHHQLLPDDPDQRLVRARDRRPAARRLRRDGPAGHRQAAVQGRLPRAACRGHRRGHRARHPLGRVRPPRRRLPGPAGQAVLAGRRRRGRQRLADRGGRSGAEADPRRPMRCSARSTCSRARRSR